MPDHKQLMQDICAVMRECGDIMLSTDFKERQEATSSKEGRHNLVTLYDSMIQDKLKDALSRIFPQALFYGEENGDRDDISKGYAFVVDPIDGTSNFIKGLMRSCISVGMTLDAIPMMGIIYDPYRDHFYTAIKGEGAFLNGSPIHVNRDSLENGIVTIGTAPYNKELTEESFALYKKFFGKCIDIRRFGSAALDMCDVAAGRTCLYAEPIIEPYDICAGVVIVEEAGGVVTDLNGEPVSMLKKSSIMADNGLCRDC
ncbi:inositol monophosphatase family protein [Butyrivibrio sp. MC2013]|uniref:inositol monophosphatase family protein n=1 Tax=Butyrivibrio sp. MC2013 TaxID=1280686 RepID=UPI0003F8AB43|nr:inositol monophosphatase family protein [Butyrivibrio sp. MC2013]